VGRKPDDEPLFTKPLDELLPPDPLRPTQRETEREESPVLRPAMKWWQTGIICGIVATLITGFRLVLRGITGGLGDLNPGEAVLVAAAGFGVGFLIGLAFWGVQWLKCRFARSSE
jgi:hypothetical protein